MELITKTIKKCVRDERIDLYPPLIYLKLTKLNHGDKIIIRPSIESYFWIEKVTRTTSDRFKTHVIYSDGRITFPAELKERYRITPEHKVQFFIDKKGRLIFSFNKAKDELYI